MDIEFLKISMYRLGDCFEENIKTYEQIKALKDNTKCNLSTYNKYINIIGYQLLLVKIELDNNTRVAMDFPIHLTKEKSLLLLEETIEENKKKLKELYDFFSFFINNAKEYIK
jgi:hypothetical protein